MHAASSILGGNESGSLIPPPRHHETPEFDITAMVDLVFMMNIYFLVTFVSVAMSGIELPAASHVAALDADEAVVLTLVRGAAGRGVIVYIGDSTEGTPITDREQQDAQIQVAVERGLAEGKKEVLLKAEKAVRLGDLFRISTAASNVEGVKLNVAVMEKSK